MPVYYPITSRTECYPGEAVPQDAQRIDGLLSDAAAALREHGRATQAVAVAHERHAIAVEKLAAAVDRADTTMAHGIWIVLILFVAWVFWRKS